MTGHDFAIAVQILGKLTNRGYDRHWCRNKIQDAFETSKDFTGIEILLRKYKAVMLEIWGIRHTWKSLLNFHISLFVFLPPDTYLKYNPLLTYLSINILLSLWMHLSYALGKCKELTKIYMFRKYLMGTKGSPGIVCYHWHKGKVTFIKGDNFYLRDTIL